MLRLLDNHHLSAIHELELSGTLVVIRGIKPPCHMGDGFEPCY